MSRASRKANRESQRRAHNATKVTTPYYETDYQSAKRQYIENLKKRYAGGEAIENSN